jgi:CRP-like cAMP-binding protein
MGTARAIISAIKIVPLTETEQKLLSCRLSVSQFAKKDMLLKEGQVCGAIHFINKGSFRHYRLDVNGEELTCNFFTEGEWVLDMESFVSQKPATGFIECHDNAELLQLSIHDIHSLIAISQNFLALGRLLNHGARDPQLDMILSPEEKYQYLLSTSPHLLQQFPLKHIASFLRITPETLSRVRRKIMSA